MRYTSLYVLFLICFKSFSQEKDLNFYLQKAQKNAPLLTDLKNQIRSNSLDSLLLKAGYKPQIAASAFANYAPTIDSVGYDTAVTNGQTLAAIVGVKKNIMLGSVIKAQANSYKLITTALLLNKKIAKKDLNKAIISQYIAASGSLEQVTYNKKIEKLLQEEGLILKKLTRSSVYKQTDYLIFLSTIKSQEYTVLQFEQQYQNDLGLLNYLAGEVDSTFVKLTKPEITLNQIQQLDKNLFLKQFEIDSLKFQNQNQLIDNVYKPQLLLLADAGYLSSFAINPHKNFGFSLGIGVTIPVFDGGQRLLNHQKIAVALETTGAYKNNFTKQLQQQLLQLTQKLKQTSAIEKQLQSQLIIVQALIDANKKLLVTGDALITEYVLALANLIMINNAISQNQINKLHLINEINYWKLND